MMKFEHRREPLLPHKQFWIRMLWHAGLAFAIIFGSLGLGITGYHYAAGFSWLDALLDASMILSGMGPVKELHNDAGKWFAAFYALFSGIAFITTIGVLFAPVAHRFLHKFHLDLASASSHPKPH